jgi:ATP-dependent DNA helicase RecQ
VSAPPAAVVPSLENARAILRDTFGYGVFRPGQQEVIEAVLARRDTLAVMPTGGGKSVCFQVPALLFEEGLTLVVSPLVALMKDQVDALRASGVAAAAINSSISAEEQARTLNEAASGKLRLLYVAPERFGNGAFMAALRGLPVALLAVDEAHCISQWGHDFRPSYRDLGAVRPRIGNPPIVALTATADPRVRADVVERLRLGDPVVHVAGFDRPNLRFETVRVRSKKEKAEQIAAKLRDLKEESAVVYCGTRKNVEELTDYLQQQRIKCARYHAGMQDDDRKRIQEAFARDSLRIIVATNAFGMGIDKPDVRMVLHHDMPDSLESYYQEAGRAGRDGAPADCVLYYGPRDRSLRDFFIEMSHPEPRRVVEIYQELVRYGGNRTHVREVMRENDEPGVNAAIHALVESGLAGRSGQMVWATRLDGVDDIDTAGLEEHRAHAIAKVDSMERYAESRACLRARILDYFGDEHHASACGNCGPCVAPPVSDAMQVSESEQGLFQALRAARKRIADGDGVPPFVIFSDATLREMARMTPRNRSEMLNVSGVGQVKYAKYGEAFLAVTRTGNRELATGNGSVAPVAGFRPRAERSSGSLTPSLQDTLELYKRNLDIAGIASERGLAPATIATHLAQLIHHGHIEDPSRLLEPGLVERVRKVVGDGRVAELSPLREALGGDVPYEQLHLVRAWLNRPE